MSISTLKRRIKSYGLKRRDKNYDINEVRQVIRTILDGPGCMGGYRYVWHTLQLKGITVPRLVVQELLKELDPSGAAERRAHKLKRRTYSNVHICNLKTSSSPTRSVLTDYIEFVLKNHEEELTSNAHACSLVTTGSPIFAG